MATKKTAKATANATEIIENNVIVNTSGWSEFPLMCLAFPIWEGGQTPPTPPPEE
jgi:hypothetical protein